ncbi:MAG: hypothetical protein ACOY94_27470 [Bacillota bacterium]
MADTAAETRVAEAVYTTARALGTGTTSTVTMEIWRLLSEHLQASAEPMSGSELSKATGLSVEQIDNIFSQTYYQKHYGFRRFDSYEAWKEWAMSGGTLYNPELHDPQPEEEVDDEAEEDLDDEDEENEA